MLPALPNATHVFKDVVRTSNATHAWRRTSCVTPPPEVVPFDHNYTAFALAVVRALRQAPVSDGRALLGGGLPCADASQGLWLEFGVYKGESIRTITDYRRSRVPSLYGPAVVGSGPAVVGFDSFLGLPEDWRNIYHPKHLSTAHSLSLIHI